VPRPPPRRISRFIVMAMLQAARASRLGLAERSAHSWGLNRAIFFAAAKRGFRGGGAAGGGPESRKTGEPNPPRSEEAYRLGEDLAYRDPKSPELYFTIGGETQTEEDFQRQIAARFGSPENFHSAWAEAERIVGTFDESVLKSGPQFYSAVYKPRRDELAEEWTKRFLPGAASPTAPNVAARPSPRRL